MILSLQILYIALLAGAMAAGCVYAWWQRGSIGRQERLERTLSQRYVRIVMAVMLSRESLPTRLPMIEMWGARALLARVLSALASSVYGEDVTVVGRIVAENDVDGWLLRRVHRSRGFVRAYYMSQLARLPLSTERVAQTECYADDHNRFVRFYSFLIRISNDTTAALRELAKYRGRLTRFEIAEIVSLLRRGVLPVACGPLLASANRNLQIVGLNIAREFGMEELKPLLLAIVAKSDDRELVQEAIYALVGLRSSLAHQEVTECVHQLVATERRSLCRKLAYEGYSISALSPLFDNSERGYLEGLVATYKCRIVCMPQL